MKALVTMTTVILSLASIDPAMAADPYPWNNHAAPFSFRFGNDIDTHQQTQLASDGSVSGFFYIHFTGTVTKDGYRVATHVDCNTDSCTVGWTLNGKPRTATFLYQVDDDHPVFLIGRPDIPEPGAYAHFHWLGALPGTEASAGGYLLELTSVDTFCFIHDAAIAVSAKHGKSCRDSGGIAVNPGIDIATHLNIVTSFP